IALGRVLNRSKNMSIANTDAGRFPRGHSANLGENISDDHPISFSSNNVVSSSPEYKHPSIDDKVGYDKDGKIQCTTCHDPHHDNFPKFLVKDILGGDLCKACHDPIGYTGLSTHDISAKTWSGVGKNPWLHTNNKSVTENSCMNCHQSHNAEGSHHLLLKGPDSESCLACHNGNTGIDIRSELRKNVSHSVDSALYSNIHDAKENILLNNIHVQCVDCHNPHRVNSLKSVAPQVNGRLAGVSGMNITGSIIEESQFEFEVCLKCHGQDKYNSFEVSRQYQNSNMREAFLPSNKSFHSVVQKGGISSVPSLRPAWNIASIMNCTDCHNNNNSMKAGGSGPEGPHGSIHENLLERRYLIASGMPYQQSNYDLCWKCHRPEIVMSENFTTFKYHRKHVDEENTPCSVCHDPHGSRQNVGLINFDTSAVFPNLNGELKFEVIGNKGYCYLQCHGEDHSPADYEK
ncbi:MAG: hypothetical protein KAR14_13435, partial [Candidatus Aminicenantes bacterium]|nr:hypothetical protein [Candidatus Aminicenantes bacterium]